MKKTCISADWMLTTDRFTGRVNLPNDYVITVPRNPNALGGAANGFFEGGRGVYTKDIALNEAATHYILDIDGGYMCTAVKWNGTQLVMHPHGYTPFLVDLTANALSGQENKLEIITDALQPSTRWYSGAGLYRDVFLWQGGEIRIEPWDLFVSTPTTETIRIACTVSADRAATVTLLFQVRDSAGQTVQEEKQDVSLHSGKNHILTETAMPNARLWQQDDPYLYILQTVILEDGVQLETDERRFGIRTVTADAKNGLLLNGQPIKLRGGCIHHDHGALGAAEYPAACRRKLARLQAAGFNALRIAHNPPSLTLLQLCDEMGILVMDEAFDCWMEEKGGSLNYHKWFADWWARDIASMVLRDRNHPCVIAYSIGNEIPESVGNCGGDEWSARLAAEIRKYDTTRFVTSATYEMLGPETWAERTEGYWKPLDICGYNYIYTRYERDHEQYPDRVIWGSETQVRNFYDSWALTANCPYVIGDFTWTAYDNLGEAGTGNFMWARDGFIPGIRLFEYPWRSCYQGDFDLCGFRRPQSYYREAIWKGNTQPHIFTTHPMHTGEDFSGTGWHWHDVLDTWTYPDAYLGKPVECEVYTLADRVEWFLNGTNVGTSNVEKAISSILIPYQKGALSVIAYKDGVECGRSSLHTVDVAAAICVQAETPAFAADGRDLCYFDITVQDKNGDRIPDDKSGLTATVTGGRLLGIFSGDPANEDAYGSNVCHAFTGRAVAIVVADRPGTVAVTVSSGTLKPGSCSALAE